MTNAYPPKSSLYTLWHDSRTEDRTGIPNGLFGKSEEETKALSLEILTRYFQLPTAAEGFACSQ